LVSFLSSNPDHFVELLMTFLTSSRSKLPIADQFQRHNAARDNKETRSLGLAFSHSRFSRTDENIRTENIPGRQGTTEKRSKHVPEEKEKQSPYLKSTLRCS
jgi:hypothetical protein